MLSELWSDLSYRLRAVFRRGAMDRELSAELEFHLEREAAKYVAEGATPEAARRRARLAFGGVERFKEESRDTRGLRWVEAIARDLRFALRGLRASPGFTLSVIVTLGLGIGANAAMFGVVDRLLFRPPAYLRAPELVHRLYLGSRDRGREDVDPTMQYTRFLDLTRWSTSIAASAAWADVSVAVGTGGETSEVPVAATSASLFGFFAMTPALGRFFTEREDAVPAGSPVVVLSYWFWRTRFGGRPDVLGQSLQVGPVAYQVIGVAPRDFVGLAEGPAPAVFVPITTFGANLEWNAVPSDYYRSYRWTWVRMVVRRKPDVTEVAAAADLTGALGRSWTVERVETPTLPSIDEARPRAIVAPVLTERGPEESQVAKVAVWIVGVAGIVLLIACANVANLLLARALRRRREIALRLALGIGRGQLFAQLLTESLVLALLGGAAGLVIARGGGALVEGLFLPEGTRASLVGPRTVGFAAIAALVAGLFSGLAPIATAGRTDLIATLKLGGRDGTPSRSRARSALLVLQGTLSVLLLVGAGLFVRSLVHARGVRLGYDVDQVAYVGINLRGVKLSSDARARLALELEGVATATPAVEAAARSLTVPFHSRWSVDLAVPGIDSVGRLGRFNLQEVSPDYFTVLGTRILRGRGLTPNDRSGAPLVIVVSAAMAARIWPGQDPLGRCIGVEASSRPWPCRTVVGVAENVKQRSLSDDPGLDYYLPVDQYHPESAALMIRFRGPGGASPEASEALRLALQRRMPGTAYVTVTPIRELVNPQLRSWQIGATMFLAFGGLALVLAAVGLYAVVAYDVAQRTTELGIRLALGADTRRIGRLVVGDGIRLAAVGVGLGSVLAFAGGRWLAPLLFQQSPHDPLVFGSVAGILLVVAVVASAIPASRAARLDPSQALRAD